MRSFFSRLAGTPKSRVKISPECDYVFIRGYGDEARGQYLRGKVTLFLAKGDNIKSVLLKMVGRIALGEHKLIVDGPVKWERDDIFLHEWDPFLVHSEFLQTTSDGCTYEWPFELFIDGNQEVSARGCSLCSITYALEASTIDDQSCRTFRNFTPIRILRCPPESEYHLMDACTAQGKWSNEIEYLVSMGQQAIALGGSVPVEAQLEWLVPGVEITNAKFYLCETHQIHDPVLTDQVKFEGQRVVTEWPLTIEREQQQLSWKQCLPLPKSVRMCSPAFDACGMSVSHRLHFSATLLGSSGIESERGISMPIALFVSPELPINGWGSFVENEKKRGAAEAVDVILEGIIIPPRYEKGNDSIGDCGSLSECPPPSYSEHG